MDGPQAHRMAWAELGKAGLAVAPGFSDGLEKKARASVDKNEQSHVVSIDARPRVGVMFGKFAP